MLIRFKLRNAPQRMASAKGTVSNFITAADGALTSTFVVLSSAAVTVTTATVLTVSAGAEETGVHVADTLVQIDPGQALNLDEAPYREQAEVDEDDEDGGDPTIIETEAVPPQGSGGEAYNPSALMEGTDFGSSGSSGGGGAGSGSPSGGGFSGTFLTTGTTVGGDPDDDQVNNALGQSS